MGTLSPGSYLSTSVGLPPILASLSVQAGSKGEEQKEGGEGKLAFCPSGLPRLSRGAPQDLGARVRTWSRSGPFSWALPSVAIPNLPAREDPATASPPVALMLRATPAPAASSPPDGHSICSP